jgi:hypothetical protein
MVRAYSTHGEEELMYNERVHKEDQDVGAWIILKWMLDRMGWYSLDFSVSG